MVTCLSFLRICSMEDTIDRYKAHAKECSSSGAFEHENEPCRYEASSMLRKIEQLEDSKRKILGEKLESCSVEELHDLESKLEQSLHRIRGRRHQLLEQQLAQLQEKEGEWATEGSGATGVATAEHQSVKNPLEA
ncbi:hypothetical protein Cni_G14474 [Canna indica]|uniref:K-box domain-containing protein n=1 Tax=Canna indica TaxID=4628 RepID=A0AAQ3QE12_9LILI|nr:hypothetical protein Cni_G14474 [Canna indica]